MDPNWFFSSLSQSAAAIIGLIGAILVSRLIQQLEIVRTSKADIVRDFVNLRATLINTRARVREYRTYLHREIPENRRVLDEGRTERTVNSEQSWGGGWSSSEGRTIPVTLELLERQERDHPLIEQVLDETAELVTLDNLNDLARPSEHIRFNLLDRLPWDALHLLRPLAEQFYELGRRCERHKVNTVPRSAKVMIWVLTWLSVFGVVAPLAYLHAGTDATPKAVLLTAFSLGIAGLVAYLFVLVKDISQAARLDIPEKERRSAEAL